MTKMEKESLCTNKLASKLHCYQCQEPKLINKINVIDKLCKIMKSLMTKNMKLWVIFEELSERFS